MISFLLSILTLSVAVFLVAEFLPGIRVKNFPTALLVAVVFGILKAVLGKILAILAFPLMILTLGLFSFVISAFLLWLTSRLIDGFDVDGVLPTLLGAFLIAVIDTLIRIVLPGV